LRSQCRSPRQSRTEGRKHKTRRSLHLVRARERGFYVPVALDAQVPADPIEKSGFRTAGGGRRIFRDANAIIEFGNDGKVSRGRLPPVVSSLFSIKAAHWRDGIRGTELGARGKERTARPRKRLRLTRRGIEHEHERQKQDYRTTDHRTPVLLSRGLVVTSSHSPTEQFEWSKNLLINQDPSGKRRGW
jgi:hypothetical protein